MAKQRPLGTVDGYHPSYDAHAFKICLLWGATNAEIAAYFECAESTIRSWRNNYPSFDNAIRAGKTEADARVAEGLYSRAVGMKVKTEKVQYDARRGQFVRTDTEEYIPPDVQAASLWLMNRQPEKWKPPRQRTELTGEDGKPIEVSDVTARELLERRLAGIASRAEPEPSGVPQLADRRASG